MVRSALRPKQPSVKNPEKRKSILLIRSERSASAALIAAIVMATHQGGGGWVLQCSTSLT
jgi:hypothetical protein